MLANPPFTDSDWRGETLFSDARKMGSLLDRSHRELTDEDIPGFCKSASLDDIRKHGHVLTPGRYSDLHLFVLDEAPGVVVLTDRYDLRAQLAVAAGGGVRIFAR